MNVQLIVIDPQNDFCDQNGSLYVEGANEDMSRLAKMIRRLSNKIDDIHVTMDSHRIVDVAHPIFWRDSNGNHPAPFTIISEDDVVNGKWITTNPAFMKKGVAYVKALAAKSKYMLCIWPPHCIIGSWGHSIHKEVSDALIQWETDNFALVDYVTKGSNLFVEHYSAVMAEVEEPNDPGTQLNTQLIDTLSKADIIPITGEALSHCLANTVKDIADNFGDENIKKLVLLTDTTSSVTGFENLGEDFIKEMTARGMQISTSEDFLK